MIYTTYFAKLRKIPNDVVPICIARKLPPKVEMLCYPSLYPTEQMLYNYKKDTFYTEEQYVDDYYRFILSNLIPLEVVNDLFKLAGTQNIALVCYEKTGDFCHRHLVSRWLNEYRFKCKEWVETD